MNTPQTAIVPDHCTAAIWLEANIVDIDRIQAACTASLAALEQWTQRFPNDKLGMTIGFGAKVWGCLKHSDIAPELKPFPSYGKGAHHAPATQCDMLIHIQSLQHDSNFSLAMDVLAAFGDSIAVQHETHGFRRHQERGLDGFVDGSENPQGDEAVQAVALDEHGGSYMMFQRYRHDLQKWQSFSLAEQEESIARHKESNEEFPKSERHPRSHIARTNLRENDVKLKIVRRSLPYGTVSGEHGLAFIAYCAHLHNIEAQLQHMFGDVADGLTDLLLERLTQAVSGGYYYAPSVEVLRDLA